MKFACLNIFSVFQSVLYINSFLDIPSPSDVFRGQRRISPRSSSSGSGIDIRDLIARLSSIDPDYWKPSFRRPNTAHAVAGKHLQLKKNIWCGTHTTFSYLTL